jgi:hypothetical protein
MASRSKKRELTLSDIGFTDSKKITRLKNLLRKYHREKSMESSYKEKRRATKEQILALIDYVPNDNEMVKDQLDKYNFTRSRGERTSIDEHEAFAKDKQALNQYEDLKEDLTKRFPDHSPYDILSVGHS